MTISELLNIATKKLARSKSTSPALDAEVLLSHILDKPKQYLFSNPARSISPKLEKHFSILLSRRLEGWPAAYLTKQKEFYNLKFYVDKNVLIPRPETEELVELVLEKIGIKYGLNILDIGTGSGNIITALAKKLGSKNRYFASDISSAALKISGKNAKQHKTSISFKQSDILKAWKNQSVDVIIANLPYLEKQTDPSTKFEPINSLVAKKKGTALYEKLFEQVSSVLGSSPSFIFLEIGENQGPTIKKLAAQLLPAYETKIFKDLTGRTRFALLVKKAS